MLIPLNPPDDRPTARPFSGDLVRRMLLEAIDGYAGHDAAQAFHRDPGSAGQPWTVSAAERSPRGIVRFRVTALGDHGQILFAALIATARANRRVLHGWSLAPTATWKARSWMQPAPALGVKLALVSGAVTRDRRGRSDIPLIDPLTMLGGWRRRWLGHAGRDEPERPQVEDDRWWASFTDAFTAHARVEGRLCITQQFWRPGHTSDGAVGHQHWHWATLPREHAAVLTTLLAYAEFSGTGRHTSYGCGQTRIAPLNPLGPQAG